MMNNDKNVAASNALLLVLLFLILHVIYRTLSILDDINTVNRELAVISLKRHIPKEFVLLDYFFTLKFDRIEPLAPRYISQDDVADLDRRLKLRLNRPDLSFNDLIKLMVSAQATDQIKYNYYYSSRN